MRQVLFARFATDRQRYLYDTRTNAIVAVPQDLWDALDTASSGTHLPDSATTHFRTADAVSAANNAGYLLPSDLGRMEFYPEHILRHRIATAISQLTLEVTEHCNFRCRYCAYTYDTERTSHAARMTCGTARRAIDVFLNHSSGATRPTVSFWGGEPLLNYGLIKWAVDYVERIRKNRTINYGFTTNATLITDDIAAFLAAFEVDLLVSLDGPQTIHDRYRTRANGRGTYADAMAGLTRLQRMAPDYYANKVRFNCVLARGTTLREVLDFFSQHELLAGHHVNLSPATRSGLPVIESTEAFAGLSTDQLQEAKERFLTSVRNGDRAIDAGGTVYAKPLWPIALRSRTLMDGAVHPNGCCVPLLRKMVVRVNGDVHMCEQTPYLNALGNVHTGVDFDGAVNTVREYAVKSLPDCGRCWAVRLCGACYRNSMVEGRWYPRNRAANCSARRHRLLDALREYADVCEQHPTAFDHLKEMTFSFPM